MEEVLSRSSRGYHSLSDQLFPLQLNPTRYHCDTTPPVSSKSRVERETRREWLVTWSHTTRSEREREGTQEQRARVRLTLEGPTTGGKVSTASQYPGSWSGKMV